MSAIDTMTSAQSLAFGVVNVQRILLETLKVRGVEFPGWNIVTGALDHGWRLARGERLDPERALELQRSVDGMALPIMVKDPEIAIACKALSALCEMMVDPPGAPAIAPRLAGVMVELISFWYADPTSAARHERDYLERLAESLKKGFASSVDAVLAAVPGPTRGLTTAPVATKFGQTWVFGFGAGAADEEEDEEDEEEDGDDDEDDEDEEEEEDEDDD